MSEKMDLWRGLMVPRPPRSGIDAVLVGSEGILGFTAGGKELRSAIDKKPIPSGQGRVSKIGLVEDTQSHPGIHGGEERALLHFDAENYKLLEEMLSSSEEAKAQGFDATFLRPGGFGENLSTSTGMNEVNVCIGDVYRVGTTVLQVSQPRKPCYQLNHRYRFPTMSTLVQKLRRTGWFYRVLEEGELGVGDAFELLERPHPTLSIDHVHKLMEEDSLTRDELEELSNCEVLAPSWRNVAKKKLQGEFMDTSARVHGGDLAFQPSSTSTASTLSDSSVQSNQSISWRWWALLLSLGLASAIISRRLLL